MENMVRKADPSKRIVLLLNKIDLVPKEAVEKWLTYLREEMPTVAFKCNTQEQRTKLGWKSSKLDKTSNIPQSSDCLGAENLIRLLKNYSRSHEDGKKPSEPVQESREESMSDANDREGSKASSTSTQHDKLYTAEGILDPRKRKAEKKRRKANKFSMLNDMDEDYDFKVDYQMKDAAADGEDDEGAGADAKDDGDEDKENDLMTA
ncbi:guanine nucleotide-binding protein-like NSN1 [Panicum miliaceum]|uniref:Guanine nucleotide-binding protein-like NSN1 n=1 Tax=Panicum miliaceum TaxID=4540 RepID=A0A3L6TKI9_PANMI|nr:guanine nucleotide-binding protein-like NSN1 [Panicum miliaceum]